MYRKLIEYEDYNGNNRTKECLFHLNQAEIIKWLTTSGDYTLDKLLERLMEKRNGKEIMNIFDGLIRSAYGEKSLDGDRFVKNQDLVDAFVQTEAYSVLFTEVVTDAKKAAEFVNGIIPKKLSDEINKIMAENPDGIPDAIKDYMPVPKEQQDSK